MSLLSHYEVQDGKVYIYTEYLEPVITKCRSWGGKFQGGAWVVSESRLPEIQEQLGTNLEDTVTVEVGEADWRHLVRGWDDQQLAIGWYVLANRRSRDQSATIYGELVAGTIPSRGGSAKYPEVCPSTDARFRLEVPRDFAISRGLQIVHDPQEELREEGKGNLSKLVEASILLIDCLPIDQHTTGPIEDIVARVLELVEPYGDQVTSQDILRGVADRLGLDCWEFEGE